MAGVQKNNFLNYRLPAVLLLLSCISFVPESLAANTASAGPAPSTKQEPLKIVIWKSHYTLTLYRDNRPVKTYRTVFGRGYRDGDKRMIGDQRTPEGDFYVCSMNHSKRFYKFMGLSYPGEKHAEYGLKSRLISTREYELIRQAIQKREMPLWSTRLGGAIGIHGATPDERVPARNILAANWTDGCIALDNADIDELYSVVSIGTPVTILP
jgi:murein L,D-transpeptidase YafK